MRNIWYDAARGADLYRAEKMTRKKINALKKAAKEVETQVTTELTPERSVILRSRLIGPARVALGKKASGEALRGIGGASISPEKIAEGLLSKIVETKRGSSAVRLINRVLRGGQETVRWVIALHGATTQKRIRLDDGIEAWPPNDPRYEPHQRAEQSRYAPDLGTTGPAHFNVGAFLILNFVVKEPFSGGKRLDRNRRLASAKGEEAKQYGQAVIDFLSVLTMTPIREGRSWTEFEDLDLERLVGGGVLVGTIDEFSPRFFTTHKHIPGNARTLFQKFKLSHKSLHERAQIAMSYLSRALKRAHWSDAAVDFVTAMEAIVSEAGAGGRDALNTLRSAMLLGGSIKARRSNRAALHALTKIRNRRIHEGKVYDKQLTIEGSKFSPATVVEKAGTLVGRLVLRVAQRQNPLNWNTIEVGG